MDGGVVILIVGGLIGWGIIIKVLCFGTRIENIPNRHPASRLSSQSVPAAKTKTTEIEITCPGCRRVVVAPVSLAGQEGECEGCRAVIRIPALPVPPMPVSTFCSTVRPPVENVPRFSAVLLRELEWKRFEQVTEAYFEQTGWRTRPARIGADGGVDIHLFRPGEAKAAAVVQCKAWNTYKVGVKPVRELLGVMADASIPMGFFIATVSYTDEARAFASKNKLTLIDGDDLVGRIRALPTEDRRRIYQLATAGDYKTPTCPRCGEKMLLRTSKKEPNVGSQFWGCRHYPRCKATLRFKTGGEG